MQHTRQSVYKAFSIVITVSEVAASIGRTWFKASFTVTPDDPQQQPWQAFQETNFATLDAAQHSALRAARTAIDLASVGIYQVEPREARHRR